MKGRKEHHHRETGGANLAEEDLRDKPEARTNAKKIDAEAEEMKRGGHAGGHGGKRKRATGGALALKRGGKAHVKGTHEHEPIVARGHRARGGHVHHEKMEHLAHASHVGHVHGEEGKHRADRKPRKSGGRTGADSHPFSSARKGAERPGGKEQMFE